MGSLLHRLALLGHDVSSLFLLLPQPPPRFSRSTGPTLGCRNRCFVALKVVRSAQMFTETALDEIRLLKCVSLPETLGGGLRNRNL